VLRMTTRNCAGPSWWCPESVSTATQLSSRQRGSALRDLPDTMRRKLAECTVNVMMLPDMVGVRTFCAGSLDSTYSSIALRTANSGKGLIEYVKRQAF
jgi:hypothetical protein